MNEAKFQAMCKTCDFRSRKFKERITATTKSVVHMSENPKHVCAINVIKVYAYVLYDQDRITGITCVACLEEGDSTKAPIMDKGAVTCDRCKKVCND